MTTPNRKGSADKTIQHTRLEDEGMIWESYDMGKKLGQGAFGKVFQVKHKDTNIEWAMKTVNKEKAGGPAIKLLEREVAILKRVYHPNIIQLNEVFETAKRMFLVMELCEGGELAEALKERKYFSEGEVKTITKELASAISYLHKNDIVHRDMKLENILISNIPDSSNPDDKLQIKVTDFGLSITKTGVGHDNMMQDFCGTPNYMWKSKAGLVLERVKVTDFGLSITKTGVGYDNMMQDFCGTPNYMSPEIIDNKTYSQQCDVWALGVIVYTLLCGNMPFRSKDEDTLYDLIKKGDIDFTSDEVWNEVSDEAKQCIRGMLNVDPAHRYTASEVLDHHWITGNQDNTSTNVLQLMREWKNDLKNDVDDTDSAINGEVDCVDSKDGETNHKTDVEQGGTTSGESQRKGSAGSIKKPGSGGKGGSRLGFHRNSVGNIPKSTVASLKPPSTNQRSMGSKSPNPGSHRATPVSQPAQRPNTQNTQRSSTVSNNNKTLTTNKNLLSTTRTTKGNVPKK